MYTYLRLACLGSTIALTSLATPAYAMDPSDKSEAVSQGPIMIHGRAYPDLSQEQQETLKDLVTLKDALWKGIEQEEDEDNYEIFMHETFMPKIVPMMVSLRKQYNSLRASYQKTLAEQMPLTSILPAIQSWKDKNPNASPENIAQVMHSLNNDRVKGPMQLLLDRGKKTEEIGNQILALAELLDNPPLSSSDW